MASAASHELTDDEASDSEERPASAAPSGRQSSLSARSVSAEPRVKRARVVSGTTSEEEEEEEKIKSPLIEDKVESPKEGEVFL